MGEHFGPLLSNACICRKLIKEYLWEEKLKIWQTEIMLIDFFVLSYVSKAPNNAEHLKPGKNLPVQWISK